MSCLCGHTKDRGPGRCPADRRTRQKLTNEASERMAIVNADVLAGGVMPKAAVLVIVGEPCSDGDKQLIVEEIIKRVCI